MTFGEILLGFSEIRVCAASDFFFEGLGVRSFIALLTTNFPIMVRLLIFYWAVFCALALWFAYTGDSLEEVKKLLWSYQKPD